jgi:hypothetical protein
MRRCTGLLQVIDQVNVPTPSKRVKRKATCSKLALTELTTTITVTNVADPGPSDHYGLP